MRYKIITLTLMILFFISTNVFAMEKLPEDISKAFQSDVKIFQQQMLEESDKTHHLDEADIYQTRNEGYLVYKLDPNKILNEKNIDLYDALITNGKWYIPVSDRVRYVVDKVDGVYKLVGYGMYDDNNAIPYEALEKEALEKGLKDLLYVDEPALHINGFIGKTSEGSKFLSFSKNDDFNLQKNEIKDGKELINVIKMKVKEAKTNGNKGFGGVGGFNSNNRQNILFFIFLLICLAIGALMFKKYRLQKE